MAPERRFVEEIAPGPAGIQPEKRAVVRWAPGIHPQLGASAWAFPRPPIASTSASMVGTDAVMPVVVATAPSTIALVRHVHAARMALKQGLAVVLGGS